MLNRIFHFICSSSDQVANMRTGLNVRDVKAVCIHL